MKLAKPLRNIHSLDQNPLQNETDSKAPKRKNCNILRVNGIVKVIFQWPSIAGLMTMPCIVLSEYELEIFYIFDFILNFINQIRVSGEGCNDSSSKKCIF